MNVAAAEPNDTEVSFARASFDDPPPGTGPDGDVPSLDEASSEPSVAEPAFDQPGFEISPFDDLSSGDPLFTESGTFDAPLLDDDTGFDAASLA